MNIFAIDFGVSLFTQDVIRKLGNALSACGDTVAGTVGIFTVAGTESYAGPSAYPYLHQGWCRARRVFPSGCPYTGARDVAPPIQAADPVPPNPWPTQLRAFARN